MRHLESLRSLMLISLLGLYGCGKPASTPESASPGSTGSDAQNAVQPAPPSAPAPVATAPPILVDSGTAIVVTADESISSKTANPGDHFDASLAAPVMVGEREVIPSGAKVSGRITEAKSAGKLKGNAELAVTLDSITVGGRTYDVKTTSVVETGKGRGKRTAIGAGGGAALGALIGGIAGHGKGAAIGAVAGGGAGTAGAAYTGDVDVTISAETKLRFKLTEPLEIRGR
jgi:hypothetical protein